MATLKFLNKPYKEYADMKNLLNYIVACKPDRTVLYYEGSGVNANDAFNQMKIVKDFFGKSTFNKMHHFILSFKNDEYVYTEVVVNFARYICNYYREYQIVFAVHLTANTIHVHFAMNSTNFYSGKQFSEGPEQLEHLKRYVTEMISNYTQLKDE